jgi:hypothetical protein
MTDEVPGFGGYDGEYKKQRKWQKKQQEAKSAVPGLRPPKDPARREACREDLHLFLRTYFPHSTGMKPFSEKHKDAILRTQYAIQRGGGVVMTCFPRGFGKTTISENTAIWASLYGHRRFIPIIGADKGAATDTISSLKFELTENDLLEEDFPEVVVPFKLLENKAQRCANQKYNGELTYIKWSAEELGFAWLKDGDGNYLDNSGACFRCLGITGRIRGMSVKTPDGQKMRPDFFILDDPQTDESAQSPTQCDKRMSIYQKSILRLGGHNKLLSGVINATVIEPDDMVDQLLSQEKHPEVEGVRIPMLLSMSDRHEDLWMDHYAEMRRTYNPEDPGDRRRAIKRANEFYAENREAMDVGAEATWEHCYAELDGEVSAIQHAYNILIDDGPHVFASECQNEPVSRTPAGIDFLSPEEICANRVGLHAQLPRNVETLGLHIDVQKKALYYCVTGFSEDFSVYPIEYGMFPEQRSGRLSYSDVKNTLQRRYKGMSDEAVIEVAVRELTQRLMGNTYTREDNVKMSVDVGLVDGGYQSDAVQRGVVTSNCRNLYVAYGRGVRAGDTPMMQLARRGGEKRSKDMFVPWRMLIDQNRRAIRYVLFCTNSLKTFIHRRIRTDIGEPGSFLLPQGTHKEFAHHISGSEIPMETEGPFGKVIEWSMLPGKPDNHLFDCLVGSAVAASISGKVRFGEPVQKVQPKRESKVQYL